MRKIILLVFMNLMIPAIYSQDIRIMTFNIRYDNPSDSIFSWEARRAKVFIMLRAERPDVAGMQEVLISQVRDILNEFPQYRMFGSGRDDGKEKGEFCPVFYDVNKYEFLKGSTFWLSQQPQIPGSRSWEAACTRIVTWVMLRERKTGFEFFVFNTHYDHISEKAREESAKMTVHAIDSIAGTVPSIITGDFNAGRKSRMFSVLASKLKPAGDLQVPPAPHPEYTFIGFPFHPNGEEIDFIFLKNFKNPEIRDYHAVTYNENGLYPSDHLPVTAVLIKK